MNSEVRTKERMEKAEYLRLLRSKILHVQAEISRNDVKLNDYRGYQRFLVTLVKMKESESSLDKQGKIILSTQRLPYLYSEELSNYFNHPSELIDLLKNLEISNLALIQGCQDAEEVIESLSRTEKTLREESEKEVATLNEKIERLREMILEGDDEYIEEFNQKMVPEEATNEEEEFRKLCENVASVYKEISEEVVLGKQVITAVTQFAQIEAHIAERLSSVSSYPPQRVAHLFTSVRNARRNEFRRQQREEEKRKEEERNRRILERAQAPPPDVAAFRRAAVKLRSRSNL
ncbi:unnamed protein product [Rodentolepis nana]|uniref:DUF4200 domain-containing protein n=1 Tax=Rodentolepis nana TaxID=102285 RepID=A0A0R3TMN2_RODNA|nr:unnamed protein product [Rodentolepis nana]